VIEQDLTEDLDIIDREPIIYEVGDHVVYPHHGAGKVIKKEMKEVLGEKRQYLTIKILHNDMTVMVPCENADRAGLRRVIGEEAVARVLAARPRRGSRRARSRCTPAPRRSSPPS
jgi:CarD family transcriptional regulator